MIISNLTTPSLFRWQTVNHQREQVSPMYHIVSPYPVKMRQVAQTTGYHCMFSRPPVPPRRSRGKKNCGATSRWRCWIIGFMFHPCFEDTEPCIEIRPDLDRSRGWSCTMSHLEVDPKQCFDMGSIWARPEAYERISE